MLVSSCFLLSVRAFSVLCLVRAFSASWCRLRHESSLLVSPYSSDVTITCRFSDHVSFFVVYFDCLHPVNFTSGLESVGPLIKKNVFCQKIFDHRRCQRPPEYDRPQRRLPRGDEGCPGHRLRWSDPIRQRIARGQVGVISHHHCCHHRPTSVRRGLRNHRIVNRPRPGLLLRNHFRLLCCSP